MSANVADGKAGPGGELLDGEPGVRREVLVAAHPARVGAAAAHPDGSPVWPMTGAMWADRLFVPGLPAGRGTR
jgi:hypothetical protein